MLDKDFIFAFDLCNIMTHCPRDTMEQTAQSYRKRVPTFQLFRMLFFYLPQNSGNQKEIQITTEQEQKLWPDHFTFSSPRRVYHTSFKSLSCKPPGHPRFTVCAMHAICTYGLAVCLVLNKHKPTPSISLQMPS